MYHAVSRTNWFRVRDRAAFDAALEPFAPMVRVYANEADGRLMVTAEGHPEGEFPTCDYVTGDPVEFGAVLAEQAVDCEIIVLMSVGHDRLRELAGYAQAFGTDGQHVELKLDQIYELAAAKFGREPARAAH